MVDSSVGLDETIRAFKFIRMKKTKRMGFNFLRSYFDVFNELKTGEDKLVFLNAILNKQFLDEDPVDLDFIPKLCYESQRHAIEKSVKGWKRATKTDLLGNPISDPPSDPPSDPKEEQEEEQEQEELNKTMEQLFFEDWNNLRLKHLKKKSSLRMFDVDSREIFIELSKHHTREEIQNALIGLFKQKKLPNDNEVMQSNPKHFLKYFNTYISAFEDKNTNLYGKTEKI